MNIYKEKKKPITIKIIGIIVAFVAMFHVNTQGINFNSKALLRTENAKVMPLVNDFNRYNSRDTLSLYDLIKLEPSFFNQ